MSFRGYQKVQVVEDHCATRERFTYEAAVRSWVEGPGSRPKTAVCFKDGGKVGESLNAGAQIRGNIVKHDDIMVQTAEKGSYKVETLLEFLDWALPVAETRSSVSGNCVCTYVRLGRAWVRGHLGIVFTCFLSSLGWVRTYVRV